MQRDSVEYLKFTLTETTGKDISADTVQAALYATPSDVLTWLGCTFVSADTDPATGKPRTTWRTTAPITWSAANYPASRYKVVAKLTDSPEIPQAKVGVVTF